MHGSATNTPTDTFHLAVYMFERRNGLDICVTVVTTTHGTRGLPVNNRQFTMSTSTVDFHDTIAWLKLA